MSLLPSFTCVRIHTCGLVCVCIDCTRNLLLASSIAILSHLSSSVLFVVFICVHWMCVEGLFFSICMLHRFHLSYSNHSVYNIVRFVHVFFPHDKIKMEIVCCHQKCFITNNRIICWFDGPCHILLAFNSRFASVPYLWEIFFWMCRSFLGFLCGLFVFISSCCSNCCSDSSP